MCARWFLTVASVKYSCAGDLSVGEAQPEKQHGTGFEPASSRPAILALLGQIHSDRGVKGQWASWPSFGSDEGLGDRARPWRAT